MVKYTSLKPTQHPNQEWRERLCEIQETYLQRTQDGLLPRQRAFRVTRRREIERNIAFSSVMPEVRTSHAQEVGCENRCILGFELIFVVFDYSGRDRERQ